MRITKTIALPDQLEPGSTTASSAVNLKGIVGNWTTVGQNKEEEEGNQYEEKKKRGRLEVLV